MDREELEKELRQEWFKDHKAKLEKLSEDVSILTWRAPGTSSYYVRYVFDYNKIYITGDLGDAILKIYDKVDLEKAASFDIYYLHEKLTARDEEKWAFDEDKAIKRLQEEINEIKERQAEYLGLELEEAKNIKFRDCINLDGYRTENCSNANRKNCSKCEEFNNYIATMENLIETAKTCNARENWVAQIYIDYFDQLEDYDSEFYEWIFDIGNDYPRSVQAFLIGLKMAWEQLKENNTLQD